MNAAPKRNDSIVPSTATIVAPVTLTKEYVDSIRESLPELPEDKCRRYKKIGLSMQDVLFLANDNNVSASHRQLKGKRPKSPLLKRVKTLNGGCDGPSQVRRSVGSSIACWLGMGHTALMRRSEQRSIASSTVRQIVRRTMARVTPHCLNATVLATVRHILDDVLEVKFPLYRSMEKIHVNNGFMNMDLGFHSTKSRGLDNQVSRLKGLTYPVAELFLENVLEKKIGDLGLAAILRKSHTAHCVGIPGCGRLLLSHEKLRSEPEIIGLINVDHSSSSGMPLFSKSTYQPSNMKRKRTHGFIARRFHFVNNSMCQWYQYSTTIQLLLVNNSVSMVSIFHNNPATSPIGVKETPSMGQSQHYGWYPRAKENPSMGRSRFVYLWGPGAKEERSTPEVPINATEQDLRNAIQLLTRIVAGQGQGQASPIMGSSGVDRAASLRTKDFLKLDPL
ncbi:hypothetical protein FXO38_24344 [Capsicum annuum]|nr:hypothetical protein FXO38_24344 [Capsicum annuum]